LDRVFEAATKRIDELKEELKKLEEFVGTYRKLALDLRIENMNKMGTSSPSTENGLAVDRREAREAAAPDAAPPRRSRVTDNPKPDVVVAEALKLIREVGRPMTRREIREGLAARGTVVNGADPVKALGTMLWRSGSDRLIQIEGRGYWPKDLPEPPQPDYTQMTLDDL
jgi:hypothetical protein